MLAALVKSACGSEEIENIGGGVLHCFERPKDFAAKRPSRTSRIRNKLNELLLGMKRDQGISNIKTHALNVQLRHKDDNY